MLVVNEEEISELFSTIVGVRQGGIVSPKFFNIYIEDLIEVINSSTHAGVTLGELKINVILYTDDILIYWRT